MWKLLRKIFLGRKHQKNVANKVIQQNIHLLPPKPAIFRKSAHLLWKQHRAADRQLEVALRCRERKLPPSDLTKNWWLKPGKSSKPLHPPPGIDVVHVSFSTKLTCQNWTHQNIKLYKSRCVFFAQRSGVGVPHCAHPTSMGFEKQKRILHVFSYSHLTLGVLKSSFPWVFPHKHPAKLGRISFTSSTAASCVSSSATGVWTSSAGKNLVWTSSPTSFEGSPLDRDVCNVVIYSHKWSLS